MIRFQLIHMATGLTLGQHKMRHPLTYYSNGSPVSSMEYENRPLRPILRGDGAIGFQLLDAAHRYGEGELFFMPRDDWRVELRKQPPPPAPRVSLLDRIRDKPEDWYGKAVRIDGQRYFFKSRDGYILSFHEGTPDGPVAEFDRDDLQVWSRIVYDDCEEDHS